MATDSQELDSSGDPLLPWLLKVKKALDNFKLSADSDSAAELDKLILGCISTFKHNAQYQNDTRFLKIWFLFIDGNQDFKRVYREMEESKICIGNSLRYEWYAYFLELKGMWQEAYNVYRTGIFRKAEPAERLEKAYSFFLERNAERVDVSLHEEYMLSPPQRTPKMAVDKKVKTETVSIDPWSDSTMKDLLKTISSQVSTYDGYHASNKAYSGKVSLSSLQNSSRNKIIEIGGKKYQIKGCAGQGSFAKVFKAYVNSNPDEVVALKIQKPPSVWEFYMYRQLDHRIPKNLRSIFGSALRVNFYSDYSILVCEYFSHGTLQDVINSNVVVGKAMEEVLCIYYTIELLHMLEILHGVGIIHGDLKPDNLLVRYSRDNLTQDTFHDRIGPWRNQGICLVDWGRGIDLSLFPENTKFTGDCRTSGFRCIEMQENRPWKYQVDTYSLCVIVHMMLHNKYMEVERKLSPDGSYICLPKSTFRRYWNVDLWLKLFTELLNENPQTDHQEVLKNLRLSFQDYLFSDSKLLKNLIELLAKQRASLCSS